MPLPETTRLSNQAPCRRRRRAQSAQLAVCYQLLHLVDQLPIDAIVIADDLGHPVAHAGDETLSALLAESALWAAFATSNVDDLTLARIREHDPAIEACHVASGSLPGGASVIALAKSGASNDAVRRAREGITRICAAAETDPFFPYRAAS